MANFIVNIMKKNPATQNAHIVKGGSVDARDTLLPDIVLKRYEDNAIKEYYFDVCFTQPD